MRIGPFLLLMMIFGSGPETRLQGAQPWLKLTSSNFELFTTAGEGKGREVLLYFEQLRSFFLKSTKAQPTLSAPVRIVAFRSDKEYQPYRLSEAADAYYLPGYDRDYIVMKSVAPEHYPIAVHEYVHLLVRHSRLKLPVWMNEGLADLYSTLKPVGSKVQVGALPLGRMLTLRQSKWLSLETLTEVKHDSAYYNERDRAGVFYAESWALTHMVDLSDEYRPNSHRFFQAIATGSDARSAFWQIYAKTFDQVLADLQNYLRGDRFKAAMFDVKLEKSQETPEVKNASTLDSGMVLASLLVHIGKTDEAKERYASLAQENPKSWQVEEALAYLALRGQARGESLTHFARAVELGCNNAKLYFDYAMVSRRENGKSETYTTLLTRAAELKPDYREAHMEAGYALMEEEKYGAAVAHFAKISQATPAEAYPMFRAEAYAYFKLGKPELAKELAERSRKYARSPEEIAAAEQMLRYLTGNHTAQSGPAQRNVVPGSPDGAPHLTRKPEAPEAEDEALTPQNLRRREPALPSLAGSLERLDCLGKSARVHLLVDGKRVALSIADPGQVSVRTSTGGPVQFSCGPQNHANVTVEFEPRENRDLGTLGEVRSLAFE